MATPRKGLKLDQRNWYQLPSISNARWAALRKYVPDKQLKKLKPGADVRLRENILQCVSWYITEMKRFEESARSAKATRKSSKTELAPDQRAIKTLRRTLPQKATWPQAEIAWKSIAVFHNDRRGRFYIESFDCLVSLVREHGINPILEDLQNQFERLRTLEPQRIVSPWQEFVCKVDDCFDREGIVTGYAGSAGYEPTIRRHWFQVFISALDNMLLGKYGHYDGYIDDADKEKFPSNFADAYLRPEETIKAEEKIRAENRKKNKNAHADTVVKAKRNKK